MPESTMPAVLRAGLTPEEQNVLVLAARGGDCDGFRLVRDTMRSVKSDAEALALIERVRVKAARVVARAQDANGKARAATPETDAVTHPAVAPATPPPMRLSLAPRGYASSRPIGSPARGPKRKRGERALEALDLLAEFGPMRQADLREKMGLAAPDMPGLVRQLGSRVVVGERVRRSPMLALPNGGSPVVNVGRVEEGGEFPAVSLEDVLVPTAKLLEAPEPVAVVLAPAHRAIREHIAAVRLRLDAIEAQLGLAD